MLGRQRAICVNEKYMDGHTLGQTVSDIRQQLSGKYSEREANAFIRIIFRNLMHYEPVDILLRKDSILPDFICNKTWQVVGELLKNRPIQYIFGQTYFCGHIFNVNESTLIPRPETEELVDMIVDENRERKDLKVLDAGTGSGCIAISLALALKFAHVRGIDCSENALAVARGNAEKLKVEVDFEHCDILSLKGDAGRYDIIVSNPPYIAEEEKRGMERNVLDYEPPEALFVPDDNPLLFYRALAVYGCEALTVGGKIYFEINSRFPDEMCRLLSSLDYSEIETRRDISGKVRFVRAAKGGKA